MKLPRWLVIAMLTTSVLAVLAAAGWHVPESAKGVAKGMGATPFADSGPATRLAGDFSGRLWAAWLPCAHPKNRG